MNSQKKYGDFFTLKFLFFLLFIASFAEIIANDKPLLVKYRHNYFLPIFSPVLDSQFFENNIGLKTEADFHDPEIITQIVNSGGFIIFPPIVFSENKINFFLDSGALSKPNKINILGTDDRGRDVLSRIIYGLRNSLYFALISSLVAIFLATTIGAVQGYFGGIIDLILQRFTEIWGSLPLIMILLLFSTIFSLGYFGFLILMTLFSWMGFANLVRAEFLRLRNSGFVMASKIIGLNSFTIIIRHLIPNLKPMISANFPFMISASIVSLASLDFLGIGFIEENASLGELLNQGKNNINSPWLAFSSVAIVSIITSLLVFTAEDLRNYFKANRR
jgi:microcin C transport system permease protein